MNRPRSIIILFTFIGLSSSIQAAGLDPALFGVWQQRTIESNSRASIHSTVKIAFSRNGVVAHGTGSVVAGGGFRSSGSNVFYGRWSTRGNIIYIQSKDGRKKQWNYSVFAYRGGRALKLRPDFFKFYGR